ncbi:YibE/F family protein [Schleiferilactobacillus harbinensis]|nr:YibE/F family protein [Schleiferilactobacillus harbinensis]
MTGIAALVLTRVNATWYTQPVGQVIAVKTGSTKKNLDEHNNTDYQTRQTLTVKMLNGANRGKTYRTGNVYTRSGAVDQQYRTGQQVFISWQDKARTKLAITNQKRDTVIVFLIWLVAVVLLAVMRWQGAIAILSVVANIALFLLAIQFELLRYGASMLWIFAALNVLFTLVTLLLILGPKRQFLVSSIATLGGTFLAYGIFVLVLLVTGGNGLHYEAVAYALQQPKPIFWASIMIGSLGAIMDETSDISSALVQIVIETPDVHRWQLFRSGMTVGREIVGPLISILFLIFMADTFPMAVLYLNNGNSFSQTFTWTMYLGMVQSLVSAIGIVVTVPLTSFLSMLFLGGRK